MSQQKVALVTGAASGIGRATALAFARLGVNTVLSDWNSEGETTASEIARQTGGTTAFFRCDVSQSAQVRELIQFIKTRFGGLDYAFNNAGIEGKQASTGEQSEEEWDRVLAINLKGVWLCMREELALFEKRGGGSIVNCASIAGVVGFPNIAPYTASKHGILGLTKTAALEYAKRNIRINAVCPGVIHTPMVDRFTGNTPEGLKAMAAAEPIGRLGEPEEIASAVLWLCSDNASFVTGHPLVIDGGWVAQ